MSSVDTSTPLYKDILDKLEKNNNKVDTSTPLYRDILDKLEKNNNPSNKQPSESRIKAFEKTLKTGLKDNIPKLAYLNPITTGAAVLVSNKAESTDRKVQQLIEHEKNYPQALKAAQIEPETYYDGNLGKVVKNPKAGQFKAFTPEEEKQFRKNYFLQLEDPLGMSLEEAKSIQARNQQYPITTGAAKLIGEIPSGLAAANIGSKIIPTAGLQKLAGIGKAGKITAGAIQGATDTAIWDILAGAQDPKEITNALNVGAAMGATFVSLPMIWNATKNTATNAITKSRISRRLVQEGIDQQQASLIAGQYIKGNLSKADLGREIYMFKNKKFGKVLTVEQIPKAAQKYQDDIGKYINQFTSQPSSQIMEKAKYNELIKQYGADKAKGVYQIRLPNGKLARGMYDDGVGYIARDVVQTTGSHEAFHHYIDKFADPILFKKAKQEIAQNLNIKGPISNLDAEEYLAEKFAMYRNEGKTFSGSVNRLFDDLLEGIRSVYGKNSATKKLFREFEKGINSKADDIVIFGSKRFQQLDDEQAYKLIRKNLKNAIEQGTDKPVYFGKLSQEKLNEINALRKKLEVPLIEKNEIYVHPKTVYKLQEKRVNINNYSPDEVIDIAIEAIYNTDKIFMGNTPLHQGMASIKKDFSNLVYVGEEKKAVDLKTIYKSKNLIENIIKNNNKKLEKKLLKGTKGLDGGAFPSSRLVTRQAAPLSDLQAPSTGKTIAQKQKLSNKAREALKKELLVSVNNPKRPIELFKESVIKYAKVLDLKDRGKLLNMVNMVKTEKHRKQIIRIIDSLEQKSTRRKAITNLKLLRAHRLPKDLPIDYKEQIEGLLQDIAFEGISPKSKQYFSELNQHIESLKASGLPLDRKYPPRILKRIRQTKTINDLSISEIEKLTETIKAIKDKGMRKQARQTARIDNLVEQSAQQINTVIKQGNSKIKNKLKTVSEYHSQASGLSYGIEKTKNAINTIRVNSLNGETLLKVMDGGQEGTLTKTFFRRLEKGHRKQLKFMEDHYQGYISQINKIKPKDFYQKKSYPLWDKKISGNQKLAILRMADNPSNLKMMLENDHITQDMIMELRQSLTTAEKQMLAINKKYYDNAYQVFSPAVRKVDNQALGKIIDYHPREFEAGQSIWGKDGIDFVLEQAGLIKPHIEKGMTKERIEFHRKKFLYDFDGAMQRHAEKISRYIGFGDQHKINKRILERIKTAVTQEYGLKTTQYLEKWLNETMTGEKRAVNDVDKLFSKMRLKTYLLQLGGNVSVWLNQAASYPNGANEIGWKWAMQGSKKVIANPKKAIDEMMKESIIMRSRQVSNTMQDFANSQVKGEVNKKIEKYLQTIMAPISKIDQFTVAQIYHGAKLKYLAQHPNRHTQAIRAAEKAVRMSQPMSSTLYRPQFLRESELSKQIFMYSTQRFNSYNRLVLNEVQHKNGLINNGKYLKTIIDVAVIPSLMLSIAQKLRTDKDTPVDTLKNMTSLIPVVSQLASSIQCTKDGVAMLGGVAIFDYGKKTYKYGRNTAQSITKSDQQKIQKNLYKALKYTLTTVAATKGISFTPYQKLSSGIRDIASGKDPRWQRLFKSEYQIGKYQNNKENKSYYRPRKKN